MRTLYLASSFNKVGIDIVSRLSAHARIAFITTAAEAEPEPRPWLDADRAVFVECGFAVTDYTFTGKDADTLRRELAVYDVLFVEGGNSYHLLRQMQLSGAFPVVRELLDTGKIYIGSSAGSIVTCPTIGWTGSLDDRSEVPELSDVSGIGLVPFLILPHWGHEKRNSRHLEHNLPLLQQEPYPTVLLGDEQYLRICADSVEFLSSTSAPCQLQAAS
jgi:dipeptidase E